MNKKIAFLFPGQGAQYPGMGKDFYEQFSVARRVFEEADEHLKRHFSKLIFEGPADELTLTKEAQVAIYIASIAILRTVQEQFPELKPVVCAGLSLGEYTALTASCRLGFCDGLDLVSARALYMQEACEETKGSMQVVLGLEEKVVDEVIQGLNPPHPVWIANINCPGQVVIAGGAEALSLAIEKLKEKGAKRALPLDVSGAFHSGFMRPAQLKLTPKIQSVPMGSSEIGLVMNVPGDYVEDEAVIREYLIAQVASPVRWEKGIRAMKEKQVDIYLEMGPGKTLAGMNKRIGITEPTWSIEKVADLQAFMESYAVIKR